uniref:KIF-binding protein n=1 Tax=Ciona savignyi TaxID=51511 RepID=H2Y9J0_CIOSA
MSDSSYIYQEKYLRAKELNAATSDPEKNPFKSKYEARNLLQNIREDVHKLREDRDGDVILSSAEAAVEYLIAVNFINTEEVSAGQEILNHIIEVSDGKLEKDPRFVSTIIAVNNELGLLWSSREEGINKAYEHLTKAEQLYQDFVKNSDETPLCIDDHFVSDVTDRKQAFESLHTNTLYYLAQAHKALGNNDESALFCKKTLQRQLEMKTLVPLEWAVNCACLSQYYITMNMFSEAKHCLACANFV